MKNQYLFTSERLGFRNWTKEDLDHLAEMNADTEVMQYFPHTLSREESKNLLGRLQDQFTQNGYTYFAVEVLLTGEWIGFIGLAYQSYVSDFTPAIDIGWRLKKSSWGNGYATEGAQRCLAFASKNIKLEKVVATCTANNTPSENVMKKIGMSKKGDFIHPELKDHPALEKCIWYAIKLQP